ncbi:MAG: DUF58 domain-containing protein [Betaproteobacteria bacterium]|nr:DUF58 domain-containing protein [Betaproteobacteria bacterium]
MKLAGPVLGMRFPLARGRRTRPAVDNNPVVLSQRKVYILPSRLGAFFCVTLMLMLLGSINYSLSLGYLLTFLLAGLGVTTMLHAWRNLTGIEVRPGRRDRAFAGGRARFSLFLRNPSDFPRHAVGLRRGHGTFQYANVAPNDESEAHVELPAERRGWLDPGRIEVSTSFPVGLFRAWAFVRFDLRVLVYPRPEPGQPPLPSAAPREGDGTASASGDDDFAGLRDYRRGDSMKRIAWKSSAHREIPVVKEFSGGRGAAEIWLDWVACPPDFDVERRISRLTNWVLAADASGRPYGLRIPGREIAPDFGRGHLEQCLTALALYAP